MKKICIYGKGGIGKSTTVANVAVAMSRMGLKVAVVGCDPKADSTRCIMGRKIPTVLDRVLNENSHDFVFTGYNGILCIESGGPEPGTGCAGKGIATALHEIQNGNILSDRDVVIYDVLGDVVCGGFSMPLREKIADDVYLVSTADFMSLYAANNICRGIRRYALSSTIRLSGIIYNERSSRNDILIVEKFAGMVGTHVVGNIPMSSYISSAEIERKTAVEKYPDSDIAQHFVLLAKKMLENDIACIPEPVTDEEVEDLCRQM